MTIFNPIQLPPDQTIRVYDSLRQQTYMSKADYPINRNAGLDPGNDAELCRILSHYLPIPASGNAVVMDPLGTFHRVYRINTKAGKFIVKLNAFPDQFADLSFVSDLWIQALLAQHRLPHLDIMAVDVTREFVGTEIQIQREITGITAYEMYSRKNLSVSVVQELGKRIAKIHTISCSGFGPLSIASLTNYTEARGLHRTWFDYLETKLDDHVEYCIRQGILKSTSLQVWQKLLKTIKRKVNVNRGSLLHGDIANHNILVHNDSVRVLIDWEDAILGDPVYDVAYWGTASFGHEDWVAGFLKGYYPAGTVPKGRELSYWFYYARISLAKAVIRSKEGKDMQFTKERLKHGLSVLDTLLYNSRVLSACVN